MKHVIITGASGLVATELTCLLIKNTDFQLYLLSTHIDIIQKRFERNKDRIQCFTLESFSSFALEADVQFYVCIHTAFSRSAEGKLIVDSLKYQQDLLSLLKRLNINMFVNISSQSVYGMFSKPLWTEQTPLGPDSLYALGKYSSEVITKLALENTNIRWTNIRLCSVIENARFIRVFVQNAIEGKPIHLTAPDQHCSFIGVRDVANGLLSFIHNSESIILRHTYNLGANLVNSIDEIAQIIKKIGIDTYNLSNIVIIESKSDNHYRVGMDASLFMQTFDWKPQLNMNDMIIETFEMFLSTNKEST